VDRSIWLWDLGSSRAIKKLQGHRAPINSLSFSAESSVLVSGSADCTVRCWDVKSAGGERTRDGEGRRGGAGVDLAGTGKIPMGPGEVGWDEGATYVPALASPLAVCN
jgi:transcription initiation factor TFIID subunit 5